MRFLSIAVLALLTCVEVHAGQFAKIVGAGPLATRYKGGSYELGFIIKLDTSITCGGQSISDIFVILRRLSTHSATMLDQDFSNHSSLIHASQNELSVEFNLLTLDDNGCLVDLVTHYHTQILPYTIYYQ